MTGVASRPQQQKETDRPASLLRRERLQDMGTRGEPYLQKNPYTPDSRCCASGMADPCLTDLAHEGRKANQQIGSSIDGSSALRYSDDPSIELPICWLALRPS